MHNLYKNNNKATVCTGSTCVTVYGNIAKVVQAAILLTVVTIAITALVKALK